MPATLAMPITVRPDGALAALAQNSRAELGQSVALLLLTDPGERRCEPDYGTPAMLGARYDTVAAAAAITRWEPRADAALTLTGDGTAIASVRVELSTRTET